MNFLVQSLIQGLIGFAIGAGTNDLAIRWVFWAIFAKKKHQIAAAVQKVVSEELMTPSKISARLSTPEVTQAIREGLEKAFVEAETDPLPSIDALMEESADRQSLDNLQLHMAKLIADAGEKYLTSASFREVTLKPILIRQWNDLVAESPCKLLPGHTLRSLLIIPAQLAASLLSIPQREQLCGALADSFGMILHSALTSDEINRQLREEVSGFLGELRRNPIGNPSRFLTEESKPQLIEMLTRQISLYAQTHVSEFLFKTRIFDIISDSIIVYDEKKMEAITRSVANRELLWVTLLGGVIGFLVGSLQGLILAGISHFISS